MFKKNTIKNQCRGNIKQALKYTTIKNSRNNCRSSNLVKNGTRLLAYRSYVKYEKNINRKNIYQERENILANISPKDDVLTIMKIDESFFKIVNHKSNLQHIPIFKSLKIILNDLLRLRHEIAIRNDCIMNIEQQYRDEVKKYDISVERFTLELDYFNKFIFQDYHKSMNMLNECGEVKTRVDNQMIKVENLANQQYNITSKIIGLYYKYRLQQKYGRFLYYLSPPAWRLQHRDFAQSVEIERMGFDLGQDNDSDVFSVLYEIILREIFDYAEAVLYFKEPQKLMEVFSTIEQHYAHDFNQLMNLTHLTNNIQSDINLITSIVNKDCLETLNLVNKLKTTLQSLESQCSDLENRFYKILTGTFYDNICSSTVLKLLVHLRFCFEKVSDELSEGLDIVALAKKMEKFYMRYNKSLEKVYSGSVKQAILKCIKEDKLAIRRAIMANRELRLAERLERSLRKSILPKFMKYTSQIINEKNPDIRIEKKQWKKNSRVNNPNGRKLTDSDLEYLQLFTEWTENEDPDLYLNTVHK